jgi:hypothetical protein
MRTLTPNTHLTPFDKTIRVLHLFHPLIEVDISPFVNDFHPKIEVILNQEAFVSTLALSPHLFSSGPSSMVYGFL